MLATPPDWPSNSTWRTASRGKRDARPASQWPSRHRAARSPRFGPIRCWPFYDPLESAPIWGVSYESPADVSRVNGPHQLSTALPTPTPAGAKLFQTQVAHHVPHPLQPLIGRNADLERITLLIRHDRQRLITLTGPGGVGKTRLALAATQHLRIPNTVFVELANLTSHTQVLPALARALDIVDGAGAQESLPSRIHQVLADAEWLLVLDNFEHVLEAATHITALLEACLDTILLATSREPLRISGEHELALQPLSSTSAVELFVRNAARAIQPDIDNAAAIEAVCKRVDGCHSGSSSPLPERASFHRRCCLAVSTRPWT